MTRDFKDYFDRKYHQFGGYNKLVEMFDAGLTYRQIGGHFGNTDTSTVYRWRQRTKKRFDGIYTISDKKGQI